MTREIRNKLIIVHSIIWGYYLIGSFIYDTWDLGLLWTYILMIALVYLHYFLVVPYLLKKPSVFAFIKWIITFLITANLKTHFEIFTVNYIFEPLGWWETDRTNDLLEVCKRVLLIADERLTGVLIVCLGSRFIINSEKNRQLERQKVENELSTIKNKIDIPIIIEILKKLRLKAEIKPESIQNKIIQLSNIIRYHLYSNEGNTTLLKELEIVYSQIDLYNDLNNFEFRCTNQLEGEIVKKGILSKVIGELLKYDERGNSTIVLKPEKLAIFLEISSSERKILLNVEEILRHTFDKTLEIQLKSNSILIQIN